MNYFRNLYGKLLCRAFGHRRGKRVGGPMGVESQGSIPAVHKVNFYRCPRCSATWTRRVRGKA